MRLIYIDLDEETNVSLLYSQSVHKLEMSQLCFMNMN